MYVFYLITIFLQFKHCLIDIFAKTDGSGSRRYYALYSDASTQVLSLYYRNKGMLGSTSRLLRFSGVNLGDGNQHRVTLCTAGRFVELLVDQTSFVNLLAGTSSSASEYELDDCGQVLVTKTLAYASV